MPSLKLYSFNVNGIRAIGKKGFWEWLESESPDVLGIQEIKADDDIMRSLQSGHPNIELTLLDNNIQDPNQNFSTLQSPKILENPKNQLSKNEEETSPTKQKYSLFWHACSMKKGYSGTAIFFKTELFKDVKIFTGLAGILGDPDSNSIFDVEGRITGLKTKHFTLINGYYPQGGREGRVSYKLKFYQKIKEIVEKLENAGEKIILCGDFNTTLRDIDLARPKENRKTTGCLPEERLAFSWILNQSHFNPEQLIVSNPDFSYLNNELNKSLEFVDTFRHFYPELPDRYSYWDQITRARDRNVGWRIDYFNASPKLLSNLKSAEILDKITGSDHCPVMVELEF